MCNHFEFKTMQNYNILFYQIFYFCDEKWCVINHHKKKTYSPQKMRVKMLLKHSYPYFSANKLNLCHGIEVPI